MQRFIAALQAIIAGKHYELYHILIRDCRSNDPSYYWNGPCIIQSFSHVIRQHLTNKDGNLPPYPYGRACRNCLEHSAPLTCCRINHTCCKFEIYKANLKKHTRCCCLISLALSRAQALFGHWYYTTNPTRMWKGTRTRTRTRTRTQGWVQIRIRSTKAKESVPVLGTLQE